MKVHNAAIYSKSSSKFEILQISKKNFCFVFILCIYSVLKILIFITKNCCIILLRMTTLLLKNVFSNKN